FGTLGMFPACNPPAITSPNISAPLFSHLLAFISLSFGFPLISSFALKYLLLDILIIWLA
ncbi:MAG: hypothetical protein K2Y09_05275, partial [Nitrosomonas sp.]|uniref:hypothetical protein n=1 Tax=Nitrosomonas sp. TaxID=42353 RepID=UPI001D5737E6